MCFDAPSRRMQSTPLPLNLRTHNPPMQKHRCLIALCTKLQRSYLPGRVVFLWPFLTTIRFLRSSLRCRLQKMLQLCQ